MHVIRLFSRPSYRSTWGVFSSKFSGEMGNDDGNEATPRPSSPDVTLGNVTKIPFNSRAHEIQAGLIDTFLNLELVDNNLYLARHLLKGRKSSPAVYGGQVIGQALAAAASTVGEGFIPNSLHSYFLKCGDVNRPILYMIDRIRDGRSFCTRLVKAVQQGEAIFTMQMSFHKPEPDGIVYQQSMPSVPPPEELQDMRQIIETALVDTDLHAATRAMLTYKLNEIPPAFERVFQFRPVEPNKVLLQGNCEEPTSAVWLKANENIGDNPRLHQCVATFISDSTLIETAMRPAIASGFVPSMALSLDHTVWMHDPDFRVDEWMLYENTSTISRGGRSFIEGRLWTRDGRLVLSCSQEGLVRAPRSRSKTPSAPKSNAPPAELCDQ